jgi:hypothetical protein
VRASRGRKVGLDYTPMALYLRVIRHCIVSSGCEDGSGCGLGDGFEQSKVDLNFEID